MGTGVDKFGSIEVPYTDSPGFWQGAENLGREGLATAADYLTGELGSDCSTDYDSCNTGLVCALVIADSLSQN